MITDSETYPSHYEAAQNNHILFQEKIPEIKRYTYSLVSACPMNNITDNAREWMWYWHDNRQNYSMPINHLIVKIIILKQLKAQYISLGHNDKSIEELKQLKLSTNPATRV